MMGRARGLVRGGNHRIKRGNRNKQRNIIGIFATLVSLGLTSLNRRLLLLSIYSFSSGLSQAALLIVVSELAVNSVRGNHELSVHGYSLSLHDSILICITLLVLFFVTSLAAAFASSSMASASIEASRAAIVKSFFTASWDVQSAERLGHVQQLLTVNCENIGQITLNISGGVQALLSLAAMLIAAFVVNPLTAGIVLVAGILLSSAMRPFLNLSRKASTRLSNDSQRMATLVTEYTTLTREFRLLGVEQEGMDRLGQRNHDAAMSYRKNRRLMQISPVVYQSCALGFVVIGLAILIGHTGSDLGATGAVLLLTLRSLTYGTALQSTSQQLRSYEGFLDRIETDVKRYQSGSPGLNGARVPQGFDITFDGVSFSYNREADVLRHISFYVPSGTIVGVVGRSGSGKTTLSQLLLGMRKPSAGHVLVGDVPASSVAKGNGLSPVALVAQEPVLLQGSIALKHFIFPGVFGRTD